VTANGSRPKPLTGIRVLDLTRNLPGPLATLHLADMGADVIRIETLTGDDPVPLSAPFSTSSYPGELLHCALNRNKRSVAIDLKLPEGIAVLRRMVPQTDVIVEGFRPGVVDRLGIGYQQVLAFNSNIVYCSISGYGQTGPYRDWAGHDINYMAIAGVLDQIGADGEAPVVPNLQVGDLLGGSLTAVMAILAALVDVKTGGAGRHLDVSMTDSLLSHSVVALAATFGLGRAPKRGQAALSGGLACYNVYRTKDDRYVAVGALERKFWETLCDRIGRPDLKPKQLATGEEARWVKEQLRSIFSAQTRDYWTRELAAADCCVTPVLDLEEAVRNEQIQARNLLVYEPDNNGNSLHVKLPVKMSDFDATVEKAAPRLGENSEDVLKEAGFSEAEIADLRSRQIIM
jgi:alpha-methylacyl-CoA racemase